MWCWPTRWPRPCTPSAGWVRCPVTPTGWPPKLGMPPWRVQKAQKQARRWSRDMVATAMRLVAALNADVKGAAADADYALEAAVRKVAELVAGAAVMPEVGGRAQSLLRACASADFLLAAWFLWITPLLAALSSLRLVETSSSAALSFSPACGGLAERADSRAKRRLHRLVAQSGALVRAVALLLRLDVGHALIPST